ncbi:deleted in malignant brain tumors 1 protein-like [Patiria miniata]|uniref:SRCR domain-containing protein n=1 Tax=Patiria miniata TaxID=46514 RepID=A0A914BTG2_PATMI|nr:deleted in malignant brain tumors 1 protein-like [Patiria miniata]
MHGKMELALGARYLDPRFALFVYMVAGWVIAVRTLESDIYGGQETAAAEELQVRLSGGFTPSEGRVMIFAEGLWRAVCDTDWGLPDAEVVCRQLGNGYATMAWRGAHFGELTGPGDELRIILSCKGTEKEVSACPRHQISSQSCGKFKTAGVRCGNVSELKENQVRLVGGMTPNVGRVEVFQNGTWSVVCLGSWDMTKASVACRELGYPGVIADWGRTAIHSDHAGILQKTVNFMSCSGLENKIFDCKVGIPGNSQCQEPATVSCAADDPNGLLPYGIRLAGGDQPNKGRVEINLGDSWGTICDQGWDLRDATVVCRQLGYPYAAAAAKGAHFGHGTGQVILSQVSCSGHERHLLECPRSGIGATSCLHDRDAGVVCSLDHTANPAGTMVRLSEDSHGFVEFFHDGQWWRICGHEWDQNDASVVCRQLGYHSSKNISPLSVESSTRSGDGGEEDAPALLDRMRCHGNESSLAFCQHEVLGPKVCQTSTAAVDCNGNMPPRSSEPANSIRLSGGAYPMEGRVEIYIDGAWATVCGDRWDMLDAEVVCRQLGYSHATSALVGAHFGPGSGPIVLDEVECVGDEEELTDCRAEKMYQHDCQHRQDAAVRCDNRQVSQDYSIRLSGGATPNSGRVEVLLGGLWHTVCDMAGTWDIREARVVCQQLGFPGTLAPWSKIIGVLDRAWRKRSLESVECLGNESKIAQCRHGAVGGMDCGGLEHEARVLCEPRPIGELPYSLRLEGGTTEREGKVRILQDEDWLPICGDNWDIADARVVCKQLGYHYAKSATTVRETFVTGQRPPTDNNRAGFKRSFPHVRGLSGFRCTGHEDHLLQCHYREGQKVGCGQGVVAHVECSDKPSIPAGERLRLSGNADENEGRVEVYFDGMWWKICGDDWDIRDASVVCHQLGYPSALAVYTLDDTLPDDAICENTLREDILVENANCDLEYLMSDLQCTGNESSVVDCRHAGFGRQYCTLDQDAAVLCDGKRTKLIFEARLGASDPRQPYEGRVELHHGGHWWLVCQDGWDEHDATVLCHQLGFPGADTSDLQPSYKAKGSTDGVRFLLDDVQCDGTEDDIAECLHSGVGRGRCDRQVAAGVRCATDPLMIQGEDIRLIGGDSVLEGRVEVYHDHRWWTVCDDKWDILAAGVACRQLGLPSAVSAVFGAYFGKGRADTGILLDEVDCKGSEGNLLECAHHVLGEHDCDHTQDAGVKCSPPTVHHQLKLPKPVRLVGGSNTTEGRVEIYHNFRWWTVYKTENQSDDMNAALIVCRQLDFTSAHDVVPASQFQEAPKYTRPLLALVQCKGSERNLSLCQHEELGARVQDYDHSQDLAIRCIDSDGTSGTPWIAPTRRKRSGPTTPVLAVIIATVFVTGFLIGSLILYHVYKACDRFMSRHPSIISGRAVQSPHTAANIDQPEVGREAKESARNKDMFIELYPLPPAPECEDSDTEGGEDNEYSDWNATPIKRELNSPPPPNTPDMTYDGTLV